MIDDVVIRLEDAVREPVVSHELPNVLDGVEFGAFWRQRDEGDIQRHDEFLREMPAGLVEENDCVGAGSHGSRDFGQMQGHCRGVAVWEDKRGTLTILRTDGTEDIGRGGALIFWRRWPRSTFRPAPGDFVLLPDPGFVCEPYLYCGRVDTLGVPDLTQNGGETFLKCSMAPSACA